MNPKSEVKRLIRRVVSIANAEREAREQERVYAEWERDNVDLVLAAHLAAPNVIDGLAQPVQYVEFLRGCLERRREEIKVVKGGDAGQDLAGLRFEQLLSVLRLGDPMIPLGQAAAIGRAIDELASRTDPRDILPVWAGDVGIHSRLSGSDSSKGKLLWAAVRVGRCRSALELGTAYGIGSLFILGAMATLGDDGHLTTIEFSEPAATIGPQIIHPRFGDQADCHKGRTEDIMPKLLAGGATFDFVYHDNGHSGERYVQDFAAMEPGLLPGAIVIFDDIRWDMPVFTKGVPPRCYEGWQEVFSHSRVERAVELCGGQLGMLLIR
jgi:predicted O-methyltransferase YrrM